TSYAAMVVGLVLLGLGGGLFFSPNTSAAMNGAPRDRLGIASATLATMRQIGMVTSFALSLAVAAGSLPHDVTMKIFVGTSVDIGSGPMQEFVVGVRHAFIVSAVLCVIAACFSLVRGKEDRRGTNHV
ncbi:MAG TPA: MFS transporter, partial [Spirochaetia bacterium]